jgi:hypothetical protein
MLLLAIATPMAVVIVAVCGLISHWRTTGVIERTTELAIKDCPPDKRAAVLRAAADLASRLHSERRSATSLDVASRIIGRSAPRD